MKDSQSSSELSKQTKLRSIRFNRFLIFRYVTALFFFVNLYWFVFSLSSLSFWTILPVILLLTSIAIMVEQTRKYWQPTNTLVVTKYGYGLQIGFNLVALLLTGFGYQELLFPFLNSGGRSLLVIVLLVGCLLGLIMEYRVWKVENNQDKYLGYMTTFENNVKREG